MIDTIVCTEHGRCANCGKYTVLWHKRYKFYICPNCNAERTAFELAHHALTGE